MVEIALPFSVDTEKNSAGDNTEKFLHSEFYQILPAPLRTAAESAPHLLKYLRLLSDAQVSVPQFYPQLSRELGDDKKPNLIYPVGGGIFIHILVNIDDARNSYIPVEPTLGMKLDLVMRQLETKLLDLGVRLVRLDTSGDRINQLLEYIDQITTVVDEHAPGILDKYFGFLHKSGNKFIKIRVTETELEGIKYLFVRDKIGLNVLEPLSSDPYIEDISCSGLGHIFIEHKIFKSLKCAIKFTITEDLDKFVSWLSGQIKKPVSFRRPIADATLPDGSRINIVYGSDVSKRGSNFTIRKFSGVPTSIFELVDFGTITYQMLAYLSLVIGNGMSVFVSGETASGKTTMLNALTTFIPPAAKIVSIEDTPELQVPHKNWIREVVQSSKVEDASGAITMQDLLRAALRQRPDEIIIGEIRGPEGNVAFQAMQTGHSVMATFHAASVEKLIQRLTGNPILVPKTYIDNLNIVILLSMVKLPNGKMGRRITSIAEIVNYDPGFDAFTFSESFRWDETTDKYTFTGYMTSFILERKIAPKLGIPSSKRQRIYAEVARRTRILTKLHKEQGITGFYEILDVLGKAQREGLM